MERLSLYEIWRIDSNNSLIEELNKTNEVAQKREYETINNSFKKH